MLISILIGMALGLVQGFLAGLLGIGGGIVIVPALIALLPLLDVHPLHLTHIAVATSLASVVVSTASSTLSQHRHGNLNWAVVKRLLPGIMVGAVAGGFIADGISTETLKNIFALFLMVMALKMAYKISPKASRTLPSTVPLILFGIVIAAFSSLIGVGGGVILVPFLLYYSVDMRHAVAAASASGVVIALLGASSYIVAGLNAEHLPDHSVGYLYWPIWLGLISTSFFTAKLGVKAAQVLPLIILKRLFALFMATVSLGLLLG